MTMAYESQEEGYREYDDVLLNRSKERRVKTRGRRALALLSTKSLNAVHSLNSSLRFSGNAFLAILTNSTVLILCCVE